MVNNILKVRSAYKIYSVLCLAIIWEIAGRSGNQILLPPVSKVFLAFSDMLISGELASVMFISIQSLIFGFALSVILGIPLGLLMGRFEVLEHSLDIYLSALLATPMISVIPILIMAFGLGLASRMAVVFLFAFVIISINTMAGVKNIDRALVEMAHSFGATEKQLFFKIMIPASIPMIMAGVRLGMGRAVVGMITGEMVLAVVGIGERIMYYGASFQTDYLFAIILAIIILAVFSLAIVEKFDRYISKWKHEAPAEAV